jgi:hypothetical protein
VFKVEGIGVLYFEIFDLVSIFEAKIKAWSCPGSVPPINRGEDIERNFIFGPDMNILNWIIRLPQR